MVEPLVRAALLLWALAGLASLVAVTAFWRSVGHRLPDSAGGIAIALARAAAAFSAIQTRAATPAHGWDFTQRLAILSWLLWETTGIWAARMARRQKGADEASLLALVEQVHELKRDVGNVEQFSLFRARLLASLRFSVLDKRARVENALIDAPAGGRASLSRVREGLAPDSQAYLLLMQMGAFLRELLPNTPRSVSQNFRIGLYVNQDGILWPVFSADILKRTRASFRSFRDHPNRFRLDNLTDPCYAVRCLQRRELLVVPDCAAVPGFYLHETQHLYLKSLIAAPIIPYALEDSGEVAAVVIDTNVADHFLEDDRESWQAMIEEFSARLNLESVFQKLLG